MDKPPSKPQPKPQRYRPGVKPAWAQGDDDEEDAGPIAPVFKTVTKVSRDTTSEAHASSTHAATVGGSVDRRLARLQERPRAGERSERRYHDAEVLDAQPEVVQPHRRRAEATVIEEPTEDRKDNREPQQGMIKDDEDHEARRARIRAQRKAEEEKASAAVQEKESSSEDEEESGESGESSDDEDDSSDDEESSEESLPGRRIIRPTFVKKEDRKTVTEKEEQEKEEEKKRLEEEKRLEEKRQVTRQLVEEQIKAEQQMREADSDADIETDNEDEEQTEAEYMAWKERELGRLRRDRAERVAEEEEQREIERRRNMTDAEIMAENRADPSKQKQRRKMQFMQKYYHAGAFFQDELSDLKKTHDFAAPTGEDSYFDKSAAPSVLQVKNFGRGSRSKYTHLADQDTTMKTDNPWNASREVGKKMMGKLGGLKEQSFDRPTKKRKLE